MKLLTFETGREDKMIFAYYSKENERCSRRSTTLLEDMLQCIRNKNAISTHELYELAIANEELRETIHICANLEWKYNYKGIGS